MSTPEAYAEMTPEQIENFRRVLFIIIGPAALLFSANEVQMFRDILQAAIDEDSPEHASAVAKIEMLGRLNEHQRAAEKERMRIQPPKQVITPALEDEKPKVSLGIMAGAFKKAGLAK